MSTWGVRMVINAALAQNQALQGEQRWYEEQLELHRRDLRAIDGETETAWQHLGEALVPALDPARLDYTATACHLPSIAASAVDASIRYEADRLHRQLAEIDNNPDYADREGLIVECELRTAEYDEMLAPWDNDPTAIHKSPAWERLRDNGYGTSGYLGKWYQMSFYRDWKEADELVERHGPASGVTTWDALRNKTLAAEAAMTTLRNEREVFVARRRRIDDLVRSHGETEHALASLPARMLAGVRGRLRSHIEPLGHERIAALLPGDPGVALALQRIAGLAAKRVYLIETAEEYLLQPRQQVAAAIARNHRDLQKLSRPKNASRTFPTATMEKRFRDRSQAIAKRRQRYDDTRTQVVQFNDYNRGSLAENFLWWDVMTDGRLDGDFIPQVHDHHTRYGRTTHDAHDDAVAAVASSSSRDHDALLMSDGS